MPGDPGVEGDDQAISDLGNCRLRSADGENRTTRVAASRRVKRRELYETYLFPLLGWAVTTGPA